MVFTNVVWNVRGMVDSVVLLLSLFSAFPFLITVTDYQSDRLYEPKNSFYSTSFVFYLTNFL